MGKWRPREERRGCSSAPPHHSPGPPVLNFLSWAALWVVGSRGDCLQNFRECLAWNTPTVASCSLFSIFLPNCSLSLGRAAELWSSISLLCFLPPSILAYLQYLILNSSYAMRTPCYAPEQPKWIRQGPDSRGLQRPVEETVVCTHTHAVCGML